jgi:hypothetical protein
MTATDRHALSPQQAAQHARTHERVFQVQLVNPAHQRQIGIADRSRQVVHTAPTDVQQLRLACDRQIVVTVDHRFALSNPDRPPGGV